MYIDLKYICIYINILKIDINEQILLGLEQNANLPRG